MARVSGSLAAVLVGVALFAGLGQDGSAAQGDLQLALVGTFAAPTYVTAPPGDDTRLFVVEQAGRIRVMTNGGAPTLFLDIASLVRTEGERGLLSMAFAPDYGTSGRFYVYYTSNAVGGRTLGDLVIAEYTVSSDPDVANPSGRIVLSIPHPAGNHNGGQLQFGPDGYLYIGTGDGGGGDDPDDNGQDQNELLGKLLRIDPRASGASAYTIPADNPFVGRGGETWGDLGVRAPESLALLVRSPDRRSRRRRRGAGRVGGDRLRNGVLGKRAGPELRLAVLGRQGGAQRQPAVSLVRSPAR